MHCGLGAITNRQTGEVDAGAQGVSRRRVENLEKVLHKSAKMATPGKARVIFGKALTLEGDDFKALAKEIEAAVRGL